jgi:hypothetical protein
MNEAEALARLLDALEALEHIGRYMHPPALAELLATFGDRDIALRAAMATAEWPDAWRASVGRATEYTLRACEGLRQADDLRQLYRALRQVNRALEALYPLAPLVPTVDRFYLAADDRKVGAPLTTCQPVCCISATKRASAADFRSMFPRTTTPRVGIHW